MNKSMSRGSLALAAFSHLYSLEKKDLGSLGILKKNGMTFSTEVWRVGDVGQLCVMSGRARFGIMRMETAIFSPSNVDAPLFNVDWMSVFGTEIQIAELYDVQLQSWPDAHSSQFQAIRDAAADLQDMKREPNWYDEILYPCSCAKKGRGISQRLYDLAEDYVACYVAQLSTLPQCDASEKSQMVRKFAEHLYAEGGVAVRQLTDLFGDETARQLIVNCMYGAGCD